MSTGRQAISARMLTELAAEGGRTETVMIDATYLKAHRTTSSLRSKGGPEGQRGRAIGRTKGGMNT